MVIYGAVQKFYLGGSFGSSVDKKNEEGSFGLVVVEMNEKCFLCMLGVYWYSKYRAFIEPNYLLLWSSQEFCHSFTRIRILSKS